MIGLSITRCSLGHGPRLIATYIHKQFAQLAHAILKYESVSFS